VAAILCLAMSKQSDQCLRNRHLGVCTPTVPLLSWPLVDQCLVGCATPIYCVRTTNKRMWRYLIVTNKHEQADTVGTGLWGIQAMTGPQ